MASNGDPAPSQCYLLHSFLKRLNETIAVCLKTTQSEVCQFLQDCSQKCTALELSCQAEDLAKDAVSEFLRKTAHLVLDFTFLDESLLVDEEFPAATSTARIRAVHELLDEVCVVAEKCLENQTLLQILGEELVECVHWRKGALLYMYCHTLQKHGRLHELPNHRECLEEGVLLLESMLATRKPQSVPDEIGPEDSLRLIQQGIYSDTHLLAMMYAAEMCFWHQQSLDSDSSTKNTQHSDQFGAKTRGLKHVQNYLSAVRGPLQLQNWNTSRAEQLEQYFSQVR